MTIVVRSARALVLPTHSEANPRTIKAVLRVADPSTARFLANDHTEESAGKMREAQNEPPSGDDAQRIRDSIDQASVIALWDAPKGWTVV
ncbi:MAG: hypothetical protein J2P54_14870 [Bradyrhizobiaceae bacterium]|nr:hypothetical protein [Bradyrhizobiaceae bacterium]